MKEWKRNWKPPVFGDYIEATIGVQSPSPCSRREGFALVSPSDSLPYWAAAMGRFRTSGGGY